MKKILYCVLVFLALSLNSCLLEDKDLFDKSASERLSQVISKYQTELEGAQYGWALEYYPEENQSYGGYWFTASFAKGIATVSGELAQESSLPEGYEREDGLYKVIGDNGPVLTFDTYNPIMHFFAEPTASRPDAYKGDYEFIIMSYDNGVMELVGKKSGNKMRLIKLTESFEKFLAKVTVSRGIVQKINRMGLSINGTVLPVAKSGTSIGFTYTENGEAKEADVAYIPTTDGFKLYQPISVLGKTLDRFKLSSDGFSYVSTTDNTVFFKVYNELNDRFSATTSPWNIALDGTGMCTALWTSLSTSLQRNTDEYGETVSKFTIGYSPIYPKYDDLPYALYLKSNGYSISYGIQLTPYAWTSDQVSIKLQTAGINWTWYTWFLPPFSLIANKSPYTISADNAENPTKIKLTSVADPTFWFDIQK